MTSEDDESGIPCSWTRTVSQKASTDNHDEIPCSKSSQDRHIQCLHWKRRVIPTSRYANAFWESGHAACRLGYLTSTGIAPASRFSSPFCCHQHPNCRRHLVSIKVIDLNAICSQGWDDMNMIVRLTALVLNSADATDATNAHSGREAVRL